MQLTVRSMKITGIIIVVLDIILLLLWASGGFYNISQLHNDVCFSFVFVVHFLIVCHFILTIVITAIIDIIIKEEKKANSRGRTINKLPYEYYTPLTWIFASIVALLGDVSLLVFTAMEHSSIGNDDECSESRIFHIAFDSLAIIVCLISIVWFIVFSFTAVGNSPLSPKKQKLVDDNKI